MGKIPFSYVLENYRLKHGYTKSYMAKLLGIGASNYTRYINGTLKPTKNLLRICAVLGITEENFKHGIYLREYHVRSKEELSVLRNLHKLDKEKQSRAEHYIEMLVKG